MVERGRKIEGTLGRKRDLSTCWTQSQPSSSTGQLGPGGEGGVAFCYFTLQRKVKLAMPGAPAM